MLTSILSCAVQDLPIIQNQTATGTAVYINPANGNDSETGRDINKPIKTLSRAGVVANAGDTVFIIGGHYTAFKDEFKRTDSGTERIYIMPYANSQVILDGAGYNFTQTWEAIFKIESSKYITLQNITLQNNSVGGGLLVNSDSYYANQSEYVELRNCTVSNVQYEGIKIQGSNVLVEECEVFNACLMNRNFMSTTFHPVALVSFWHTSQFQDMNRNNIFKNNRVHDSWGEGVAFVKTDGFVCEGNQVYDCPYTLIYADNSFNGTINNNVIYSENPLYYRNVGNLFVPANGIFWAAEGSFYTVSNRMIENINIFNNLILKTSAAFGWFDDDLNTSNYDSYKNINICHNTVFHNIGFETFYLEPAENPQRIPPTNCSFKNNILDKAVYEYFTNSIDFVNYWSVTNNCFAEGNIPSGFQTNNISGDPSFVNPSGYLPENYKIQPNSICRGAGILTNVTHDFWGTNRTNPPCIGFHEVF